MHLPDCFLLHRVMQVCRQLSLAGLAAAASTAFTRLDLRGGAPGSCRVVRLDAPCAAEGTADPAPSSASAHWWCGRGGPVGLVSPNPSLLASAIPPADARRGRCAPTSP